MLMRSVGAPRPYTFVSRAGLLLTLVFAALPGGAAGAAVLVELFTAQGCSTCPPADRLLSGMGTDPDLRKEVVPLAFHVDYWNSSSWRDRFSDAAWTRRQNDYVRAAGGDQVYTPQAVINGGKQCVGSDVQCIKAGVQAAATQPQGQVAMSVAADGSSALEVAVTAQAPAGVAGLKSLDVMVAVYESGLETAVSGGENAHKTLHNDFVVRRLERAFGVSAGDSKQKSVRVKLDEGWQRDHLGVAVFLQDPKSQRVYGAASAPLLAASR
jgi:hypothetical protein